MEKLTYETLTVAPQSKKVLWVMIILISIFSINLISAAWTNALSKDIRLVYDLDETSGKAIDIVNGTYNSSLEGTVTQGIETSVLPKGYGFDNVGNLGLSIAGQPVSGTVGSIVMWLQPAFNVANPPSSPVSNYLYATGASEYRAWFTTDPYISSIMGGLEVSSDPIQEWTIGDWIMLSITWDMPNDNITIYKNDSLLSSTIDASHSAASPVELEIGSDGAGGAGGYQFEGNMSEVFVWNRVLNSTEITQMYNSGTGIAYLGITPPVASDLEVILKLPADSTSFLTTGENFTANYTSNDYNLTNATYYIYNSTGIWNSSEIVTISGTVNTTTVEFFNFTSGNYEWNVFACGTNATGSLCNWSTPNYTFSATLFSETSITYNTTVFETSNQYFNINLSADPLINSVSGGLWYNGTRYTSTIVDWGGGVYQAYNNIDIPLTTSTNNKTFLWEFTFILTSGATSLQNSSTYSHQVNRTFFEPCEIFTTQSLNFTTHIAKNPYLILNASFKMSWDSWLGEGVIKRGGSWENVSELNHTFTFCLYPVDRTFNVNSQTEFDAAGYSQNYHYLDDAELTNTTTAIDLYLLNESDATLTVLKVQDEAQKAIENVTIQIQLYDVGTDTFYTVGMAKTAFNGEDLVYLNWYDSLYKFVLTQNGEVLKQTTPYKITETPQIFEIITEVTFPYDKFRDFVYDLYYNNVTQNFVLTFTKPSGTVDAGCLRVIKRNPTNDTEICNTCETSSSATLYCNIAAYGNGTFYATFYATGSLFRVATIYELVGVNLNPLYDLIGNINGTVYAILFVGIVLAMFLLHPIFAIVGTLLGMIGAIALGFQPLVITELVGIIIMGVFIIWLIKR